MNEVSIIANGVRYDAVEVQPSEDRCVTRALSEMCFMLDCFPRFCDTFIKRGWHFKKSDKKFEA